MPEGFTVHPRLLPQLEKRPQMVSEGGIDWAMGETLAFGSLLLDGHPVRLAGQDTRRGTFGQRHSVIVDRRSGAEYTPLAHLSEDQAPFYVYDSLLSEYAAMGFEYGYSVARPECAGAVGGAVRRLRQRRAGDHRRVHLGQRGQVGPALGRGPAAPARLRRPGPGPLVGPHRALPRDVRRGQLDHRDAEHTGQLLPPAAPAGAVRAAASRSSSSRRSRCCGCGPRPRCRRTSPAAGGRPSSPTRHRRIPRPSPGCGCAAARSTTTWSSSGRSCRPTTPRSSGSSSSTRCPIEEIRTALAAYPNLD